MSRGRTVRWKHGDQVNATGELVEVAFQNSISKFVGLVLRPDGTHFQGAMEDLVDVQLAAPVTPAPEPKRGSLLERK